MKYKEITPDKNHSCQNRRGKWVPAIPEPYYHSFTCECECGRYFWNRERYEEHYAYKHILGM